MVLWLESRLAELTPVPQDVSGDVLVGDFVYLGYESALELGLLEEVA